MTAQFVRERITQLRMQKGVSEYRMSYDLGHSRGYINNISSGKSLPSMLEFFAICDYFGITPIEYFNEKQDNPKQIDSVYQKIEHLNSNDLDLVEKTIDRLLQK